MKYILTLILIGVPFVSTAFGFLDIRSFSEEVVVVLDIVFNILITTAFVLFFWGVAKFILSSGSEQGIKDGKTFMIYGVSALFVLISMKGILLFFSGQLELGDKLEKPLLPASDVTTKFNP